MFSSTSSGGLGCLGRFRMVVDFFCFGEVMKKRKFAEIAFDVFTLIVTVFDVVSDLIVAYQFYTREQFGYFYGSCAIFILCQMAYSLYFCVMVLDFADGSHLKRSLPLIF